MSAGEALAEVGSLNDDNFDPPPKQNAGVIGAAVYRGMKQSYVVASSAQDGLSPATMTYGVPGTSPSPHIVYDAPEAADGSSSVTAAVQDGRCVVTIAVGAGGGFAGHPLMFSVSDVDGGCKATESTNVGPGQPPPGGGVIAVTSTGSGASASSVSGASGGQENSAGGCGCATASSPGRMVPLAVLATVLAAVMRAGRRRRRRTRAGSRTLRNS